MILGGAVFIQIVAFLPRELEEDLPAEEIKKEELTKNVTLKPRDVTLKNEVPDYTIKGFQYVSILKGTKQWKIIADEAFFYQKKGVVTAREVNAEIYDENGKTTFVESREAEYFLNSRNLDLFKKVMTRFPDGIVTESEIVKYDALQKKIWLPKNERLIGHSLPEFGNEKMNFQSNGFTYSAGKSELFLESKVTVHVESPQKSGRIDKTTILSDSAKIDRTKNEGLFLMDNIPGKKPKLVLIEQPNLKCTARTVTFNFNTASKDLELITARNEVTITETFETKKNQPKESPRIATGGIAQFFADENKILLKEYPQVVQDHDTITGEAITLYRDKDEVEVERSNAYSERKEKR